DADIVKGDGILSHQLQPAGGNVEVSASKRGRSSTGIRVAWIPCVQRFTIDIEDHASEVPGNGEVMPAIGSRRRRREGVFLSVKDDIAAADGKKPVAVAAEANDLQILFHVGQPDPEG